MTNEDLSRLKIDRGSTATGRTRKKRFPLAAWLAITAMLVVLGFLYFRSGMAVEVESTTITTAYPSQSFTLLNATGYVVAQRKAAVASKATGRVEWLGVTEGSKVTEGEIIARLENADVTAAMDQAAASVNVAKANLQQAQSEWGTARQRFHFAVRIRYCHCPLSQGSGCTSGFRRRGRRSRGKSPRSPDSGGADADPCAVRWSGADEKCEHRGRCHSLLFRA